MCKVLKIPRSTYYYELSKQTVDDSDDIISHKVVEIFNMNRQCFGTRRIKYELNKLGLKVSRRRIGRIMKSESLVSAYTSLKYRTYPSLSNERNIMNNLGRNFIRKAPMEVLVSDLTYVKVSGNGITYVYLLICLIVRLSDIVQVRKKIAISCQQR